MDTRFHPDDRELPRGGDRMIFLDQTIYAGINLFSMAVYVGIQFKFVLVFCSNILLGLTSSHIQSKYIHPVSTEYLRECSFHRDLYLGMARYRVTYIGRRYGSWKDGSAILPK